MSDVKMFQISEDDLRILESELPLILDHPDVFSACNNPIVRKRWDAVKVILSNVRWGYGPPLEVHNAE